MICDNCFHAVLVEGEKDSHNDNWCDISFMMTVKKDNENLVVCICNLPILSLTVNYKNLSKTINYGEGELAYQATKARRVIPTPVGKIDTAILGRTVGKVKNYEVIEEYFLDGINNMIIQTK